VRCRNSDQARLWPGQAASDQGRGAQHRRLSRPGDHPDRSDGELDPIETANWFAKLARKDPQIGVNIAGSGVGDPDQQFFENYACGSERNYTGYCNAEIEKRFVEQSETADRDKRRHLVWDIDRRLQEDAARPIIYHTRLVTCRQPQLKGLTVMINSQFNGWRMEDVWLDR